MKKANLADIVKCYYCFLGKDQHKTILNFLLQYEDYFNETLSIFHSKVVLLEEKKDVKTQTPKSFLSI